MRISRKVFVAFVILAVFTGYFVLKSYRSPFCLTDFESEFSESSYGRLFTIDSGVDSLCEYLPPGVFPAVNAFINQVHVTEAQHSSISKYAPERDTMFNYLQYYAFFEEYFQTSFVVWAMDEFRNNLHSYDSAYSISTDSAIIFSSDRFNSAWTDLRTASNSFVKVFDELLQAHPQISGIDILVDGYPVLSVLSESLKREYKQIPELFEIRFITRMGHPVIVEDPRQELRGDTHVYVKNVHSNLVVSCPYFSGVSLDYEVVAIVNLKSVN